jgi:hypothetical protein
VLSCKEITQLVSESLDRRLPLRQRLAIRVHILLCTLCNRYRRHLLFIRDAVRLHPDRLEAPQEPTLPSLSPEARGRIKHSITQED